MKEISTVHCKGFNIDENGAATQEKVYINPPKQIYNVYCLDCLVEKKYLFPYEYYSCSDSLLKVGYHVMNLERSIEKVKELVAICFTHSYDIASSICDILEEFGLKLISLGAKIDNKEISELCLYYFQRNKNGKINPLPTLNVPIDILLEKSNLLSKNKRSICAFLEESELKIIGICISKNTIGFKFYSQFAETNLINYLKKYYRDYMETFTRRWKKEYELLLTGFVIRPCGISHNFYYI